MMTLGSSSSDSRGLAWAHAVSSELTARRVGLLNPIDLFAGGFSMIDSGPTVFWKHKGTTLRPSSFDYQARGRS